ncbi:MAG: tRNA lysidine(34) synthetase TilS [Myxococcales bacterium]|nr:tRNA lysidine(34) synthetase TilS [Myxococcales bacterium]
MSRSSKDLAAVPARLEAAYRRCGAEGKHVLLAVSGGADSTALLIATAQLSDRLALLAEVASLDHCLRPESAAEVQGVRALASALGLRFHTRKLELSAGPGVEERSREARYRALEEIRRSRGIDFVATAHTATDQAETLLMRLCRGSSLRGAAGILAVRGSVIRPLLEVTRPQIEEFLASSGARAAIDPMNGDRAYARVRVRRDVLPALEAALGPSAVKNLARFAKLASEDDAFLSRLAEEAFAKLSVEGGGLDASGVSHLELPVRRRVVARLIEGAGSAVDGRLIERALGAIDRRGGCTLARGLLLKAQGGVVRCVSVSAPTVASDAELTLLPDHPVEDSRSGLIFEVAASERSAPLAMGLLGAALPLTVRHRRAGDRVGSRKLQDLLVDLKVRSEDRDLVPLVCDANGRVLWVVGLWPRRSPPSPKLHLGATPAPGTRAHKWLSRYRLVAS